MEFFLGVIASIVATAIVATVAYLSSSAKRIRTIRRLFGEGKILLVGMSGAGKTSFITYFLGTSANSEEHMTTLYPTHYILPSASPFEKYSNDVLALIDTPGTSGPCAQAKQLSLAPECLLVFLRADDRTVEQWLTAFCHCFADEFLENPRIAAKLRRIVIVLNKADVVSAPTTEKLVQRLTTVARTELRSVFGSKVAEIVILPSSSIPSMNNQWLKELIRHLKGSKHQELLVMSKHV